MTYRILTRPVQRYSKCRHVCISQHGRQFNDLIWFSKHSCVSWFSSCYLRRVWPFQENHYLQKDSILLQKLLLPRVVPRVHCKAIASNGKHQGAPYVKYELKGVGRNTMEGGKKMVGGAHQGLSPFVDVCVDASIFIQMHSQIPEDTCGVYLLVVDFSHFV